jgi:peptidoglycan hydrolase-like protein with peptidoglycan-binding domain
MGDRKDLDKDGDRDLTVTGPLDKRGKQTISALESLCASEPTFMPKLEAVCKRIGTETEWLVNVMMMESSLDPSRKNPSSSGSGLIQFMAKTARGLGTTTAALRRMSATKQLDYVEKYFRPFAGSLGSQAAVYSAVGAGKVGKTDRSVLFRKGQRGYAQNKVWDVNKDGAVTQGEMGQVAARFGAGTQFDIDDEDGETSETSETSEPMASAGAGGSAELGAREGGGRAGAGSGADVGAREGHMITASVGTGGENREADVGVVQSALQQHGFSPGSIDRKIGPITTSAIRRFQRGFMRHPDGLVEVGRTTEQHLMSNSPPPREREGGAREGGGRAGAELEGEIGGSVAESVGEEVAEETSNAGAAQMQRLESAADNVAGRRPGGMCYRAVKGHISRAGGYGNIRNIYADRRFTPQGEARNFAEVVNPNPDRFGLERLSISNPYDAPVGSIVVVAAGSPGTRHATAGDIAVKGPGEAFYNDGNMNYQGREAWPPRRGGVLGVYRPK